MSRKIRLAIPYTYNENWIGGTYYIQNLLWSLTLLPAREQPEVTILTSKDQESRELQELFENRFVIRPEDCTLSFSQRLINVLLRPFLGKDLIDKRLNPDKIDLIFPTQKKQVFERISRSKMIYWIPDLQHKRYPHYFTDQEIKTRNELIHRMIVSRNQIVFSSESSQSEFSHFFPEAGNKCFVLPFTVFHTTSKLPQVREKYGIDSDYFIVANQFWQHKNHLRLFEAIAQIGATDRRVKYLLTGKMHDYRNNSYIDEVKDAVHSLGIEDRVQFLGFIPREDQLSLMASSLAVIQPSLYEGWSTVIEDAKCLNKWVIASSIEVHQEQLKQNCSFFNPNDVASMSKAIASMIDAPAVPIDFDYRINQLEFARNFAQLLQTLKVN